MAVARESSKAKGKRATEGTAIRHHAATGRVSKGTAASRPVSAGPARARPPKDAKRSWSWNPVKLAKRSWNDFRKFVIDGQPIPPRSDELVLRRRLPRARPESVAQAGPETLATASVPSVADPPAGTAHLELGRAPQPHEPPREPPREPQSHEAHRDLERRGEEGNGKGSPQTSFDARSSLTARSASTGSVIIPVEQWNEVLDRIRRLEERLRNDGEEAKSPVPAVEQQTTVVNPLSLKRAASTQQHLKDLMPTPPPPVPQRSPLRPKSVSSARHVSVPRRNGAPGSITHQHTRGVSAFDLRHLGTSYTAQLSFARQLDEDKESVDGAQQESPSDMRKHHGDRALVSPHRKTQPLRMARSTTEPYLHSQPASRHSMASSTEPLAQQQNDRLESLSPVAFSSSTAFLSIDDISKESSQLAR